MSDKKYNLLDALNEKLGSYNKLSSAGEKHIESFIASIDKEMKLSEKQALLFKDDETFKAKNIYSEIFADIKKDTGTVCFTLKFDVSDNQDLTTEMLKIEDEEFYYGKVTLGKQTVLYILRWDTKKHIESKN